MVGRAASHVGRLAAALGAGEPASVESADDAHRHGIGDMDIEHAVRNAIRVLSQGNRDLFIDDGQPVVIHAMTLRPKFYEHL